ncbi:MAG: hypothetical protein JXB62_22735 [Pirellulales bacterium]|nr:hypothetical protein [Pirellulales bacterium]
MKIAVKCLPIAVALLTAGCGSPQSPMSQTPTTPNTMTEDSTWNDTTRSDLREALRNHVVGELRLANSDHDEIIQACREVYIEDECPEDEWESFVRFATEELRKADSAHSAAQATWPRETDCDRLDHVEATLRDRGILLWQVSPCCDTCTFGELPDRIDEIDRRYPGFRGNVRGYAFFIDQNMADMLATDTDISVYLAYGWFSQDDSSVAPEVYKQNALGIAREVCDCLREHGFKPNWDGSFSNKIGVSLNWQRRTMLQ